MCRAMAPLSLHHIYDGSYVINIFCANTTIRSRYVQYNNTVIARILYGNMVSMYDPHHYTI